MLFIYAVICSWSHHLFTAIHTPWTRLALTILTPRQIIQSVSAAKNHWRHPRILVSTFFFIILSSFWSLSNILFPFCHLLGAKWSKVSGFMSLFCYKTEFYAYDDLLDFRSSKLSSVFMAKNLTWNKNCHYLGLCWNNK